MNDLFSQPAPRHYPDAPGYAKKRPTSRAAAESVWKPTEMQGVVLRAIEASRGGLTDHEIADACKLPMARVQPRRSELSKMTPPKVIDGGERRATPYGKSAVVWVIA